MRAKGTCRLSRECPSPAQCVRGVCQIRTARVNSWVRTQEVFIYVGYVRLLNAYWKPLFMAQ